MNETTVVLDNTGGVQSSTINLPVISPADTYINYVI